MERPTDRELIAELRKFDTPSITNVVATYPGHPLCLGLYNPWTENWYTDQSIRCMFPELGPTVGYAVTCVHGMPDPSYDCLTLADLLEALGKSRQPTILAFPAEVPPGSGRQGRAGRRRPDHHSQGGRVRGGHLQRSLPRHR